MLYGREMLETDEEHFNFPNGQFILCKWSEKKSATKKKSKKKSKKVQGPSPEESNAQLQMIKPLECVSQSVFGTYLLHIVCE